MAVWYQLMYVDNRIRLVHRVKRYIQSIINFVSRQKIAPVIFIINISV